MTPEQYAHYNDPVVLEFCESRGVLPPPYWSPDGKSGSWEWNEGHERVTKGRVNTIHHGTGAWVWIPDESGKTVIGGLHVKSNKEEKGIINWFKRIFRGSFSARRKNLKK